MRGTYFFYKENNKNRGGRALKKPHGFTLIELLVVVAIIGIIAGVLVAYGPQYIQNAKQKSTMKDINAIATACASYTTINGQAPASGIQEGILISGNEFIMEIAPEHMPVCPTKDKWGNPFVIYTGTKTSLFRGFYNHFIRTRRHRGKLYL